MRQGFHRGPVLRTPGLGADVLRRTLRLCRGGDIQGYRARGIRKSRGTQEGDGFRAGPADRCRPCLRALPAGPIDTGPARYSAPAGKMESLGRRDGRHDPRARRSARTDDGRNAGGGRPVRARLDQRMREVGAGRGEGVREEARPPARTAVKVGQARAKGTSDCLRRTKLQFDRAYSRDQQEHRARYRETAQAGWTNVHSRRAQHQMCGQSPMNGREAKAKRLACHFAPSRNRPLRRPGRNGAGSIPGRRCSPGSDARFLPPQRPRRRPWQEPIRCTWLSEDPRRHGGGGCRSEALGSRRR